MSSVNKVILVGRLGADPEIRYTQSGQPVGSLRLATSENWTDRDGNRQERTEWHSVTVWGKQAELCGQYLAKGRQAYIEGRLQMREYTDREGVNRRAWDVVANHCFPCRSIKMILRNDIVGLNSLRMRNVLFGSVFVKNSNFQRSLDYEEKSFG